MSTRSRRPGALRRAAARVGVVGAMLVGLTGLGATAALAHHPEIEATTDCTGVVEFTSYAWQTDDEAARTNSHIEIDYRLGDGDWTSAPEMENPYHFGPDNDFTVEGAFTPQGAQPGDVVTVRAHAIDDWGNGVSAGDDARSMRTTQVTVQEPCPAGPSARIGDVVCEDGAVAVVLTNDSHEATEFTVTTKDGDEETSETVEAGAGQTVHHMAPLAEDHTALITVTAPDMETVEKEVTRDCHEAKPSATIDSDCDGTVVSLDNTAGTQSVVFTVTAPSGEQGQVEVPAGEKTSHTYPPTGDQNATFTVEAPGMEPITSTTGRDCAEPGPVVEASADCEGFVVRLGNDGAEEATYTVTLPDGATEEHTIKPGSEPRELTYLPAEPGGVLTVSSDGMEDVTAEMPADCAQAASGSGDAEQGRSGDTEALAHTGASSLGLLLALAAGLLVIGGGTLLFARRRRSASGHTAGE